MIRAACGPAFALLLACALLVAAPALAQEDELVRLRRAIAERRERVASFEREERGLFEAIEAADEAARARSRAVRAERDAVGAGETTRARPSSRT
jgi:hypothetical protein